MTHSNSFFCGIKNCRKTWRNTPEYLTLEDWNLLEGLRTAKTEEEFYDMLCAADREDKELVNAFFDRVISWPEGYLYYFYGPEGYRKYAYPSLYLWLFDLTV